MNKAILICTILACLMPTIFAALTITPIQSKVSADVSKVLQTYIRKHWSRGDEQVCYHIANDCSEKYKLQFRCGCVIMPNVAYGNAVYPDMAMYAHFRVKDGTADALKLFIFGFKGLF